MVYGGGDGNQHNMYTDFLGHANEASLKRGEVYGGAERWRKKLILNSMLQVKDMQMTILYNKCLREPT